MSHWPGSQTCRAGVPAVGRRGGSGGNIGSDAGQTVGVGGQSPRAESVRAAARAASRGRIRKPIQTSSWPTSAAGRPTRHSSARPAQQPQMSSTAPNEAAKAPAAISPAHAAAWLGRVESASAGLAAARGVVMAAGPSSRSTWRRCSSSSQSSRASRRLAFWIDVARRIVPNRRDKSVGQERPNGANS
jgi:hypothetical protein